jgi:alpha-L-rhamnosidase
MKRYVDYLGRPASIPGEFAGRITLEGFQDWGLGDWCPVEETPRTIINSPAYYHYARILSQSAELLSHQDEARRYAEAAETMRAAFDARFLDPATGIYGPSGASVRNGWPTPPLGGKVPHEIWWQGDRPCTQAGQVLPLALEMVPPEHQPAAQKALLREIAAHRNRLSTGFVSTPYLLQVLADLAPEVGWAMTSARDYPSWYGMTVGSDQDLLKETWAGGQALMPSLGGNIAA